MNVQIKNYNDSFLYGKANYRSDLYQYIIKAERIDKSHPGFDQIRYLIRRNQTTSCLGSLIDKNSIVLTMPLKPMSRAFKVLAAKDIKEDCSTKVFIDVSGLITFVNNEYTIKNTNVEIFISYLACALNTLIYHTDPKIIINNSQLMLTSTEAFAKLCTNIIDYMRIGSVDNIRPKMMYISSLYYQIGMLLNNNSDSVQQKAMKISKLSQREADIIQTIVVEDDYKNIDTFVKAIAKLLKVDSLLKVENFIDKWILLYGSGTQFACEIYTAFANLLINAYVGAYVNNQKQIEKISGRSMVEYCNILFRIGGDLL